MIEALFKDLVVVAVVRKDYSQAEHGCTGTSAIVYVESQTQEDLIACTIEIPWDKLATYGIKP